MKVKDLRSKFRCYIVDENSWEATYEELTKGKLTDCVEEAKNELERMIEEFDEDKEDFKEDLDKVEAFLKNPKEELSKVKEGYKPLYVNAPLGYTISIE
jgi:aconitase B